MDSDTITIQISGGYGRVVSATGVIAEMSKRNPDKKINIVTGFPEIFIGNPNVNKCYSINHEYLFDDHIAGTIYKEPEPYKLQGYVNGDLHIANGFALELLGEDKFYKPELFLKEEELEEARMFVKSLNKPVVLFQPFGSMGGKTKDGQKMLEDPSFRSLPIQFAKELYKELSKEYQVVLIKDQSQLGFQDWMTLPPLPLRKILALIPFVHGVVSVDSSLQHACAALNKKAIVFWGSTNSNQLGYDTNVNHEGAVRKIQYNPVRMLGNDFDAEKRYANVWQYLNDTLIRKVLEELHSEGKDEGKNSSV